MNSARGSRLGWHWVGLIVGLGYWPFEAAVHAWIFRAGSFFEQLVGRDANELWMRTLITLLFVAFGWAAERMMRRLEAYEARLSAKKNRLQRIIDSAYDAFVAIDGDGRVTAWNRRAEEVFGWPMGEALGRELAELIIPPEQRDAHRQGMWRYRETSIGPRLYRPLQAEALTRRGERIRIELVVTPLASEAGQEYFAFIRPLEREPS